MAESELACQSWRFLGPFREQVDQNSIIGLARRMIMLFAEGPLLATSGHFITGKPSPTDGREPDQLTTPIDLIVTPEETVTVVDPRHPLFGRTLPCVGISNSSYRGRCCIVWIGPTVERHIPVSATNLEFDPTTLSPLAISVESLRQLVYEFTCMTHTSKGEQADGNSARSFSHVLYEHGSSLSDPASSGLEDAHSSTTNNGSSGPGHYVPAVSASHKGGHR